MRTYYALVRRADGRSYREAVVRARSRDEARAVVRVHAGEELVHVSPHPNGGRIS